MRCAASSETPIRSSRLDRGIWTCAYLPHNIVGCDVTFAQSHWPTCWRCGHRRFTLPFSDESFAAVVSSDVLEHVPPDLRPQVISETLRVARRSPSLVFRVGPLAQKLDEDFLTFHHEHNIDPPEWLTEHMQFVSPNRVCLRSLNQHGGCAFRQRIAPLSRAYQSRRATRPLESLCFRPAFRLCPRSVNERFSFFDRPFPVHRQICIIERAQSRVCSPMMSPPSVLRMRTLSSSAANHRYIRRLPWPHGCKDVVLLERDKLTSGTTGTPQDLSSRLDRHRKHRQSCANIRAIWYTPDSKRPACRQVSACRFYRARSRCRSTGRIPARRSVQSPLWCRYCMSCRGARCRHCSCWRPGR